MAWDDTAACQGMDLKIFFPGRSTDKLLAEAKRICLSCPVQEDCLAFAIEMEAESGLHFGIYGGKDPDERKELA